ncbi:MAG: Gfo/Idh/MocA family oxidoreductase [Candidatus Bathyarchaeota archaeon]|nr:Gfo/Idh/MocA family oxidoreductase [Candidatus Bathyarchaeota archaeon]MCZ2845644.1 Gfo/Idh/MocA family oxidoreductase [Candidatus Bathyarchaeota archaeon]
MINVGVIGLGHMGLLHLRNTRFIDGIKIVAAADKSKKGLVEAKSLGIKNLYNDYKELLKLNELDAVIISLPNFLHEESITFAAEKGLHIFIEKPLARTVSECKKIQQVTQRSNVNLAIGHNYRFFPHVQKLRDQFENGILGDIEIANFEHFVNGPFAHPLEPIPIHDWWLNPQLSGGGALLDQGYHLIDLFRWFFSDSEVLYSNLGYRYHLPIEDSAIATLKSRHVVTKGIISVGWFQKMLFPHFNFRLNLQGTTRYMSTDHFIPQNLYSYAAKEVLKNVFRRIAGRKIEPLSYTYYYNSYFKELHYFFEGIKNDIIIPPLATVVDGLKSIQIIEECYKNTSKINRKT